MLGNCYLESLINPAMFQGGQDNPCGIKYQKPSDIGAWSIDQFWAYFFSKLPLGLDTGYGIVQWTSPGQLLVWSCQEICGKNGLENNAYNYWDIVAAFDYHHKDGQYDDPVQQETNVQFNTDIWEMELKRIIYEYNNNDVLKEWAPVQEYPISWDYYAHSPNLTANYCGRAWCRNYERASAPSEYDRGREADYYYNLITTQKSNRPWLYANRRPFYVGNGHQTYWRCDT